MPGAALGKPSSARRVAAVVLLGLLSTGCAAAPPPAPGTVPGSWQADMLAQVNDRRAAAGVAPLQWCATVAAAAQAHSEDQAAHGTMSHTGSDGSTPWQRLERAGYTGWSRAGENVAYGYATVDAVMTGWMGSSGHRANILDGRFTDFGAGLADNTDGVPYWTQDFGTGGTC